MALMPSIRGVAASMRLAVVEATRFVSSVTSSAAVSVGAARLLC
jgi:hypothetical protein